MLRKWKMRLVVGALLVAGAVSSAYALLPAALFVWMGASTQLATAVEASLYIHAGAYAIYDIFFAEKGGDGKPSSTPQLVAKLSPTAARSNPDPTQFDDPAPGARDVTPKTSVAASGSAPASDPALSSSQCYSFTGAECSGTKAGVAAYMTVAGNGNGTSCGGFTTTYSTDGTNILYSRTFTNGGCGYPPGYVENGNLGAIFVKTGTRNDPSSATCPPGYTQSGGGCTLSNPAAVKKPSTTPCEILRTPQGLQTDSANPNCDSVQIGGNAMTAGSQSLSVNADNSVSISNPSGQTTLQLSGPNADGSMSVIGASRSGNPGAFSPTSGTGSSTCGGVGQPACSGTQGSTAGSGSGSCGGAGQVPCSIDDSGFAGAADPGTGARAAFDLASTERGNTIRDQSNTGNGLGLAADWVPKPTGINTPCEPFVISFLRATWSIDFCRYVGLIREVMGYLFYMFAGLYIWKSFMGSGTPGR